jgi:hypothetical protein
VQRAVAVCSVAAAGSLLVWQALRLALAIDDLRWWHSLFALASRWVG